MSVDPNELDFVPEGWDIEVDVGDDKRMLHYPGSERMIEGWRFVHRCLTGQEGGHRRECTTASRLHPDHQIVSAEPLTITPSILCRGCGTHGWVRDGRWVSA